MSRIELETSIAAPPELCFDLSLSVELHLDSAAETDERVVGGVRHGLLGVGDEVIWEARHLGLRHRLTMRISAYDRPHRFSDELVRGPFRQLGHHHEFESVQDGTRMLDAFVFTSGVPPLDAFVLKPHLRRFLLRRNELIKRVAESDEWRRYV